MTPVTRAIQNIIDMQSDEIKQLEAALKEERNRVGTGDLRIAELQAENARLLDLIEPWVSVEDALPEDPHEWVAILVDFSDGEPVWYRACLNAHKEWVPDFTDGLTVNQFLGNDARVTHWRRIKGPSPTLIKEDRNNG